MCASFSLLSTIAKMSAARSSFVHWCHWSSVERKNTNKTMIYKNLQYRQFKEWLKLKPCSNGKCLVTMHNQTLPGDQTWPNSMNYVWLLSNWTKCLALCDQMLWTFKFYNYGQTGVLVYKSPNRKMFGHQTMFDLVQLVAKHFPFCQGLRTECSKWLRWSIW